MARKTSSRRGAAGSGNNDTAQAVRDSAQKIWLAGLGAFERAKSEGPKMFEVLVEQGKGLREKARDAADQALKKVNEASGEAQGRWDKLEQVFEDRVSRTLGRLGVRSGREVDDLAREVRELNETVRDMMRAGTGTASKPAAKRSKASAGARAKAKAKPAAAKRPRAAKAKAGRASRARQA
jgi:poly(hydroxyalkanoate) granule-associated protein